MSASLNPKSEEKVILQQGNILQSTLNSIGDPVLRSTVALMGIPTILGTVIGLSLIGSSIANHNDNGTNKAFFLFCGIFTLDFVVAIFLQFSKRIQNLKVASEGEAYDKSYPPRQAA